MFNLKKVNLSVIYILTVIKKTNRDAEMGGGRFGRGCCGGVSAADVVCGRGVHGEGGRRCAAAIVDEATKNLCTTRRISGAVYMWRQH